MSPNDYGNEMIFPFEEILQESSIVFYHCELEPGFPIRFISSNVSEILGFEDEDFRKNRTLWFERVHPQDRHLVKSAYLKIAQSEHAVLEFRFQHKEGHFLWVRNEVKLVNDNEGNHESLVGSSIEITEQKEAEDKLRDLNRTLENRIKERTSKLAMANKKLKRQILYRNKVEEKIKQQHQTLKLQELAMDNLNDMVIITQAPKENPENAEIIFVNKAFEQFTGYQFEEVLGRRPTFLHGPKTSQEVLDRITEKISRHESLREEFINYTKDGEPYWVELDMAPFLTVEDEYEYWVGINRDITRRKKAEQKIEESGKRYRAFAELSFDAIFEIALDGTIINCNKRACELFGYTRKELIGMNTIVLTPEEYHDSQPDSMTNTETTGDEAWERTYRKKDGTLFPTEIHTQMYEIAGQQSLVAYVRDNTAHKKYENAIQKSLKEKETLLAEIHHRVKNNLAIISGLLEMQAFNTEDEKLLEKLQESQSRIQSIAMVHEKLYSSDSFSEIAIDQYIDDLADMITGSMIDAEKNIRLEKNMDSILLTVSQAIPCGLLLNELITNSCKHAFPTQKEGAIFISLKEKDNRIVLSVEDDGIGLPEDFDIRSQSSLGMTLINTLVRQLDGSMEVIKNGGSHFKITFKIKR